VRLLLDVAEQSSGTMVRNLWLKLSIEVARMQPEVLQPVTMTVSTRSFAGASTGASCQTPRHGCGPCAVDALWLLEQRTTHQRGARYL
jgi:hypothetical protein